MSAIPVCPYCGNMSEKTNGAALYSYRPDLAEKTFYRCRPCKAYVGCHPGTDNALGRLANAELRAAKKSAHRAVDPIWKRKFATGSCTKKQARSAAYLWLAETLGIEKRLCHIGMTDVETCKRIAEVSRSFTGEL